MTQSTPLQETPRQLQTILIRWIGVALTSLILSITVLAPRTVGAQASAGITGTITDTTGAVIAGAQVTITNDDTGIVSKQ